MSVSKSLHALSLPSSSSSSNSTSAAKRENLFHLREDSGGGIGEDEGGGDEERRKEDRFLNPLSSHLEEGKDFMAPQKMSTGSTHHPVCSTGLSSSSSSLVLSHSSSYLLPVDGPSPSRSFASLGGGGERSKLSSSFLRRHASENDDTKKEREDDDRADDLAVSTFSLSSDPLPPPLEKRKTFLEEARQLNSFPFSAGDTSSPRELALPVGKRDRREEEEEEKRRGQEEEEEKARGRMMKEEEEKSSENSNKDRKTSSREFGEGGREKADPTVSSSGEGLGLRETARLTPSEQSEDRYSG